jgi:hypothetical protein
MSESPTYYLVPLPNKHPVLPIKYVLRVSWFCNLCPRTICHITLGTNHTPNSLGVINCQIALYTFHGVDFIQCQRRFVDEMCRNARGCICTLSSSRNFLWLTFAFAFNRERPWVIGRKTLTELNVRSTTNQKKLSVSRNQAQLTVDPPLVTLDVLGKIVSNVF